MSARSIFSRRGLVSSGIAFTIATGGAVSAQAAMSPPSASTEAPFDLTVHDANGAPLRLSWLRGKPVVLIVEDDSCRQNAAFEAKLASLIETRSLGDKLAVVPVLDVSTSGSVAAARNAILQAEPLAGTRGYADWKGEARRSLGVAASESTVVLLDRAGKILWATAGALTPGTQDGLLDLIETTAEV
jgi:hypothetical protein